MTPAGDVAAVSDVSFEVASGSLVTLLGPSGCGKTTTLRLIAGLERADAGTIVIDGATVSAERTFVPANRRPIGMVFQSYAIWPHMTVAENVAFPLRVNRPRIARSTMRERVEESLALVGLESMADRPAPDLSGGQQQRVALARALVRRPKVLLLDEPLSNLDPELRERMREEIREIQQRLAITSVFVTHDHAEALAISDEIIVMQNGKIAEVGPPEQIYSAPRSTFTARFLRISNCVHGSVVDYAGARVRVDTELGVVQGLCEGDALRVGDRVVVFFRPERLRLSRRPHGTTTWRGIVQSAIYRGDAWDYRVTIDSCTFRIRAYKAKIGLKYGDEVFIEPEEDAALVLRETTLDGSDGESPPYPVDGRASQDTGHPVDTTRPGSAEGQL